jgi:RND family efflux transporter MFP subunit
MKWTRTMQNFLAASLLSLVCLQANLAMAQLASPAVRPALTISVAKPHWLSMGVTIRANGNIAAWQEASVGSQVGGLRVADVRVNVGDIVKRDQVLAMFATDTVLADLAVQKAQEAEAVAALAEAQANAGRARSLKNSGALSAQQISQYLTAEQTAKARLEAVRAQVQVQNLRLLYAEVRAPDDGVISARQVSVGAVVPIGTELFKMLRQRRLEWRADVVSEELDRIRVGMPVRVHPASFGKESAPLLGNVRVIGPTVDMQARTAVVYVDLPTIENDTPVVRAGMFASGEFELGNTRVLTLPQESVVMRDGFSYVFKVRDAARVSQVRVEVGRRLGARVEILKGVGESDVIAESGAGFLNNDDAIAIASAQSPATSEAK